jgi:hypothetical protein
MYQELQPTREADGIALTPRVRSEKYEVDQLPNWRIDVHISPMRPTSRIRSEAAGFPLVTNRPSPLISL